MKNCIPKLSVLLLQMTISIFGFASENHRIYSDSFAFLTDDHYGVVTINDTVFYQNGSIKETGKTPLLYDSAKSGLKVGLWVEYYPTGEIKSKGNYDISKMEHKSEYCYKVGHWYYFYQNGNIKAEGRYKNVVIKSVLKHRIMSSYIQSRTDKSWTFRSEKGKRLSSNKSLKKELNVLKPHFTNGVV
ncbi:MAG: hypothetical protein GC181_11395 [Bacteroidetes bacterium]|nr:hypothetical protein [Bacteroidota bacterium]